MLVFDDKPLEQAKAYANVLKTHFYAISDGEALRLFRTDPDKLVGDYQISLTEEFAKKFLKGLAGIYVGSSESLDFNSMKAPFEKVREMTSELGKVLLNVFEDLSGKERIRLEQVGHVKYLHVGNAGSIFRLGLYEPEELTEDFIDVRLELLRRAFKERFEEIITELSNVPAFSWIKEGNWQTEPNKPRNLKTIAAADPNLEKMRKDLEDWLIKISEASWPQ